MISTTMTDYRLLYKLSQELRINSHNRMPKVLVGGNTRAIHTVKEIRAQNKWDDGPVLFWAFQASVGTLLATLGPMLGAEPTQR